MASGDVTQQAADAKLAAFEQAGRWQRELEPAANMAKTPEEIRALLEVTLDRLLLQSSFIGEFVTPDQERAALFSKGKVVRFECELCQLREMLRGDRLYVGMEKIGEQPAVEVAFLPDRSGSAAQLREWLVESYSGSTEAAKSQLFN